jgi:hypothetical protein
MIVVGEGIEVKEESLYMVGERKKCGTMRENYETIFMHG